MSEPGTFGDRVCRARRVQGFTQAGLADRAGMSRLSVANYEQGRQVPSPVMVERLARVLLVPAGWLRDG